MYAGGKPAKEIFRATGVLLASRVISSYESMAIDFTTPDAEMLTRLTRDVWQFSAAKNYQQMRDLTLSLKDEKGKRREFVDFEETARKICDKYNRTWLRSEYDFAVAASQTAARWTEFKKDAGVIPNLEYQTVGDDNVRDEHQLLDGVIRPLKDVFWDTHYPPNGWGCRCEAIQSLKGVGNITKTGDIPNIQIPTLFKTNLAKTGLIYPKNHPYYTGVPKAEIRKAIVWLPPENSYHTVFMDTKIPVDINVMHNDGELANNLEMVNDLTNVWEKRVKRVKLLPDIHQADAHLKKKFLPEGYKLRDKNKNPDSIIEFKDNKAWVVDFKYMTGNGSRIAGHINEAYAKADYVIIKLTSKKLKVSQWQIEKAVTGKMSELSELKGVIVFDNGGKIIYEMYK